MAMSTLESGPKLDWTRDNQMYECYRIWRKKVEFIFCSALADSTPKQLVSYLKYWMGDQGIPLIEKWESTGKLDYSNSRETPATEGGRRKALSSGYKLQTYWDLLDEEFKPKGNKLLSIIELWTRSKQGDKPLNQWLTQIYNLVNICKYPENSTDRIIRDVLIVGCNSNHARDKIIRQGEAVTLNEVIEILQTEESTHSTMQQIQSYDKKSTGSIYYQTYDSRSKKSKSPSNEQNSSSSSPTGSKKKCFRCGETFSRQHMKECRAQDITCNGCGIKGHLQKCCKKSGNFPKNSNRQNNQSSSTGPGRMNIASTLPHTDADFFDEKGILKEYTPQNQHTGSMYVLKKFQGNPNNILFSDNGVEVQQGISTSVSDPDPAPTPIPTPDFPFQEFPLTEVVRQSQIDISSISDASEPRETSNSSSKATTSTDSALKSGLNNSTTEELRENRDLTASAVPTQSLRDFNTIFTPDNSATRESNPGIDTRITTGIMTETPTTFSEETDVTAIHAETPEELQMHSNNYRSVIPTDTQALTALQNLISDDFQAKDTHSTQRKGEKTPDTRSIQRKGEDETFQLIQKIHNQLQEVQWDLQRLHSLHKYKN